MTVDLSHYDLKDKFTAYEAACLMAGVDPYAQDRNELIGTAEWGRITAFESAIQEASEAATRALAGLAFFEVGSESPDPLPWDWPVGSNGGQCPMLPSVEHRRAYWEDYVQGANPARVKGRFFDWEFSRSAIEEWLLRKGWRIGHYFMPTQATEAAPADTTQLMAELAQMRAENERLRADQARPARAEPDGLTFTHETDLLRLVASAQARYLGATFDVNDRDSYPAKENVIEWLMRQTPGLSRASAEAIDRVAMPFKRGK